MTTESEDDFDWDDEDSDEEANETKRPTTKDTTPSRSSVRHKSHFFRLSLTYICSSSKAPVSTDSPALAPPQSIATTRESSLDSFDVVSSANASVLGEGQKQPSKAREGDDDEEEDDDSDWE